jgi:hypothetical protein
VHAELCPRREPGGGAVAHQQRNGGGEDAVDPGSGRVEHGVPAPIHAHGGRREVTRSDGRWGAWLCALPAGDGAGRRAGLAAVGLALLVSGCAKPYNPFRIARDELRGRIHIIALAPIRVDPDVVDAVPARERIERMARERLSAGGFTVVETKEMERLWREAATDVGDVFDPITGKGDEKRFKLVEDAVYRELGSRYRVNAVLYLLGCPK